MNLGRLEKGQGILWYNEMAFWLKLWKQTDEYDFLKACPSQVLQQKLMDQGWYEFRRQLRYKLYWQGGSLAEVDYRCTSQQCSCCGYTEKENRRSQAEFVCLVCGYEEHADVNAAKNILTVGLTGLACGSNRKSGRKQEPAGNSDGVLPMAS